MGVVGKTVSMVQSTLEEHPLAAGTGLTLATSTVVWAIYKHVSRLPPEPPCPKDTVLLYQSCRGSHCPSLGPFNLKLETYLRMAGIPYVTDLEDRYSPKGKIPWIRYNGQVISDSSFCISVLNQERGIDLNKGMSEKQRAIALAFQKLLEEEFYWCGVCLRYSSDEGMQLCDESFGRPFYLRWVIKPKMMRYCYAHGIGRHTLSEVRMILLRGLKAIADFMGSNQFFMGDTPTEVDCVVFAFLAQGLWHGNKNPAENVIIQQYPKLHAYCERMRQLYWPDWNQCVKFPDPNFKPNGKAT